MKNFKLLFAIVTLISFTLVFAACDDTKDLSGEITISPTTATTGTELTANYSGNESVKYQWNKDETAIDGKTSKKFTPSEAGSYTVTVSAYDSSYNSKTSTAVAVTAAIKNLSGNITISPSTATLGMALTANYSGSETVTYQWNKNGTAISGRTAKSFTPTEAGSYTVTVSASGYNSKTSSAVSVGALGDSVSRNFNSEVMFTDGGTDYLANIVDARTGLRYQTLEQLDVITQLSGAISAIYDNATGLAGNDTRIKFSNIFGPTGGNTIITVENPTRYNGAKTPSKYEMTFHFDYLTGNPADLQQAIIDAVTAMNDMPNITTRATTRDTIRLANAPVDNKAFIGGTRQSISYQIRLVSLGATTRYI